MPMHIQEAPMDSVGLEKEYVKLLGEGVGGIGEKVEGSRWGWHILKTYYMHV